MKGKGRGGRERGREELGQVGDGVRDVVFQGESCLEIDWMITCGRW